MKFKRPPLAIQPTTLWEYPSQDYGEVRQGVAGYKGATPSYIIWNLLQRYTQPKDLVIDPCAGSGTTLDVARDLGRRALGYDLAPARKDIFRVDSRKLPLEDEKADFVFIDPPYSTHIHYSDDPRCIGKLDAADPKYYQAMEQVISEIHRVLRPGAHMGLYCCDSFVKGKGFFPIGFELFAILRKKLEPVDIVAVVRHNKTLEMGNYRAAAEEGNFYLRGFNYLFIMRKSPAANVATVPRAGAPPVSAGPRGESAGSKTSPDGSRARAARGEENQPE
jgi:SAM-dependent methyltransferase